MATGVGASGRELSLISQLLKRCSGYSHLHHPGRHLLHLPMSARLSVLSSFILDNPILCRSCVHSSQHTTSLMRLFRSFLLVPICHQATLTAPGEPLDPQGLSAKVQVFQHLCTCLLAHSSAFLSGSSML